MSYRAIKENRVVPKITPTQHIVQKQRPMAGYKTKERQGGTYKTRIKTHSLLNDGE